MGVKLESMSADGTVVLSLADGSTRVYEVREVIGFNSDRKRMSVVVKHNGRIELYTKGADMVIIERLRKNQAGTVVILLARFTSCARHAMTYNKIWQNARVFFY